ncbi:MULTISPECIES: nuclear transport factor 2 family protein [unclassified Rhizobium]|uniref:nuclear transport factor 2 family protein n=1 Tax=unclassified Rhizobium TaxID=2613769 RepID=UPI001A97D92B|nr:MULTISPECIES: nuclear transport factor 2 family protein [unclassified Rhizobium]MBX5157148.1 nuclear transport factor 2 family protein [Rhizobium sp. NZLR8]MBX5165093.1 nuclear transport factor 2 family protein [Rhizobium sp. NZLR4b]MBX5169132.1 nuclear transport factor 2 family protein [Rhizobium sp. NZLR1b]MBX5185235.1 nuclear transport factor 2 family protein [Rhizobium sp. NZLR5]MBX5189070.1 nuclear transport factor 2 family protein [Rhizobium sp. NZLR3b]
MNDMRTRQQTVRDLYAAYLEDRKDKVDAMLAEDFTFSSPRDDHIDRATYFERCWPKEPFFRAIHIEFLAVDGDEAVVRYRAEKLDGGSFCNIESLRFRGDKIAAVEVYFGRNL